MPFTPYHFGPALLGKSLAPSRFSFTAFAATSVVVDLETAYNLYRGEWPVHLWVHSVAGSLAAGLLVAGVMLLIRPLFRRLLDSLVVPVPRVWLNAEFSPVGVLAGSLAGAILASLLDSLMHSDLQPFWPFSSANPLLLLVGPGILHGGCFIAGALGFGILFLLSARMRLSGRGHG